MENGDTALGVCTNLTVKDPKERKPVRSPNHCFPKKYAIVDLTPSLTVSHKAGSPVKDLEQSQGWARPASAGI